MNCDRLKIAFAGTPEFAAVSLDALIDSGHDLVGVLTQPDRPAGRGRKMSASAVKIRAQAAGINVLQPKTLKDPEIEQVIAGLKADVMVVAAYGLILPQSILDIPELGCLNIHASLLPRWRGAAPIHRAILAGDKETGVCIMQMQAGLDTGDVLLQKKCDILPDETVPELHDRLALLGSEALLNVLPDHCHGRLQATVQSESGVTYAEKLSKSEARIDFSDSSEHIHRQVRAYVPWPVAEATLCGERVRLWSSRRVGYEGNDSEDVSPGTIVTVLSDALRVRTGDGYIDFTTLQWPGKKAQEVAGFVQGRTLLNERFTAFSDTDV